MTCEKCGAMVGNVALHDQWHAEQDQQEHRLELVEQQADATANVLYQRGID